MPHFSLFAREISLSTKLQRCDRGMQIISQVALANWCLQAVCRVVALCDILFWQLGTTEERLKQRVEAGSEQRERGRVMRREAASHWCWVTLQRDHGHIPWVFGNNGGAGTHLPPSPDGRVAACVFQRIHVLCLCGWVIMEDKGTCFLHGYETDPYSLCLWEMLRMLSEQCVGWSNLCQRRRVSPPG